MPNNFDIFNKNKKAAEKLIIIGGIIAAIGGILMFILNPDMSSGDSSQILGFVIIAVGFFFAVIGFGQFTKISHAFKGQVLVGLMKEMLPGAQYDPNAGLSEYDVYRAECLRRADRYHSEDLITGMIEDVKFQCSDVRLEERRVTHTKNGTQVYYVPYFTGRVFEFTFNKEFDGYLQVLENGSPLSNRPFKKVALESIDFNKKFRTFSTQELSAFYVLTPDIMEQIMKLEAENPGSISFSFTGETLYIAINNNKNTFDLKLFRKIDDSIVEEFKRDLLVVKDIVLSLKLNQKIFKK